MFVAILIGILALSLIILTHELGHFIAAKATDVRVEEFGIGFPPRLWSFKIGETVYSLNAIPFGGFNRLAGEEDPKVPRSLASKGVGTRLLILSAGSLMNIVLALVLFSLIFMIPHQVSFEPVVVADVAPGSPAYEAGIAPGDKIIAIADKPVNSFAELQRYIQLNLGQEITVGVERGELLYTVNLTPRWNPPEGEGAMGITLDTEAAQAGQVITTSREPFWRAIPLGVQTMWESTLLYKNGLIAAITGVASAELTGPIGIAQMTGEVTLNAGVRPLLEFTGLISMIVGIMNLLPLPALDGGRLVFVVIEWIRHGKRVSPQVEGMVHLIGFALLMILMLVVTYQDIARIVSGEMFLQ